MRIRCCCLTCVTGDENDEERVEEARNLLHPDGESELHSAVEDQKQPCSVSTSAVSHAPILRETSAEGDISESFDRGNDKFKRTAGLLKKYNVVSSRYHTKNMKRQLSSPVQLELKVGFKINVRSSTVKVSVIEARNIMPLLEIKGLPDLSASTEHEPTILLQVRTKILHSEVRGHTKKYHIEKGTISSSTLKFRSETVHTIDFEEFLHSRIRFRLYFVMKHQRDKLLGEYTLDVANLNVDTNKPVTQIVLVLYDPSVPEFQISAKPPELVPVWNRLLSTEDSFALSEEPRGTSPVPKIQRQPTIQSQHSEVRLSPISDVGEESQESLSFTDDTLSSKKSVSKVFKKLRPGLTRDHSGEEKEHSIGVESTERLTALERMRMAAVERGEKVEELDKATEALANSARNFGTMSIKLRQKYKT